MFLLFHCSDFHHPGCSFWILPGFALQVSRPFVQVQVSPVQSSVTHLSCLRDNTYITYREYAWDSTVFLGGYTTLLISLSLPWIKGGGFHSCALAILCNTRSYTLTLRNFFNWNMKLYMLTFYLVLCPISLPEIFFKSWFLSFSIIILS